MTNIQTVIQTVVTNGYILIIPILIWNAIFYRFLPHDYQPKIFNANIPKIVSIGEFIGRILIFGMPFFMRLNIASEYGKIGIVIYGIGILIYFSSWLLLILFPSSFWAKSVIGFTAPAFTIIIWLIGFSLIAEAYYFGFKYSKWQFILASLWMVFFHTFHAALVFLRQR